MVSDSCERFLRCHNFPSPPWIVVVVAVLVAAVALFLTRDFSPTTKMAGHALFANFNIDRFFVSFFIRLLLPGLLLSLILWKWLGRSRSILEAAIEPNHLTIGLRELVPFLIPTLLGFLGAGWIAAAVMAVVYAMARFFIPAVAEKSVFLAPFLLYLSSRATQIIDDTGGRTLEWFGEGLLICAVAGLVAFARFECWRNSLAQWKDRLQDHMGLPILLFLLHAKLPPTAPRVNGDFFHAGEMLVPYWFWRLGDQPWRDFLAYHGPMGNLLRHWVGTTFFENTWWGSEAGDTLIAMPLYFVLWYFWSRRIFVGYPVFSFIVFFLLPITLPGAFGRAVLYHQRFLLYPLLLVLFQRSICNPTKAWHFWLGAFSFGFVVLTPEAGYFPIALGVTLCLHQRYIDRGHPWAFWAGIASATVMWGAILASQEALWPFVDYHRYMLYGYRFVYGKAPQHPWFFRYEAALCFLSFATIVILMRRYLTKTIQPCDWVAMVSWMFMVLYCQKFLASADEHIFQVYAVSFPLIAWFVFQCWIVVCSHARWMIPVGALILLSAPLLQRDTLIRTYKAFEKKFISDRRGAIQHSRAGPILLSKKEKLIVEDLGGILTHLVGKDRLFDLTDQPLLFHFLLGYQSANRFYEAIGFASPPAQQDVIMSLRRYPPPVVIFSADYGFSISYPVPPSVRYYRVSRYVLENYRPLVRINGYLILGRADRDWSGHLRSLPAVRGELQTENLYTALRPCDWGFIPFHWGAQTSFIQSSEQRELPVIKKGSSDLSVDLAFDRAKNSSTVINVVGLPGERIIARFRMRSGEKRRVLVSLGSCLGWHDPVITSIGLTSRQPISVGEMAWE